jgi:hypothetical protein
MFSGLASEEGKSKKSVPDEAPARFFCFFEPRPFHPLSAKK